ncbi:MAG: tRNA (adenosine(37)-N6)-dimethylallyltransferase MiaA [Clostridia bacterium]|nr:tRNA (adenosine(37)-N6)-dimethylallyltransferase MiaA [Clostridia bacterium]
MKKVIAIVGPTASGKSALAVELAKHVNGEVISCDSMQIYKHLDIGTAKPTFEETQGIAHHMIDVVDPSEIDAYSCAEFVRDAKEAINDVISRKKMPILCGGTGLYVDNILSSTEFSDADTDLDYREELFKLAEGLGNDHVYRMLVSVDPESAAATHPNNLKRVIRALEIYHATGITKTEWDRRSHEKEPEYDAVVIGLAYLDREKLYERIDTRVDIMIENGLVNEVRDLLEKKILRPGTTAAQAIGYKELIGYLEGETSLEAAADDIKRESRRYAKRQMTWFKRNKNIHWIYPDSIASYDDRFKIIVNNALELLTKLDFCAIL